MNMIIPAFRDDRGVQVAPELVIESGASVRLDGNLCSRAGQYVVFQYTTITGAQYLTTSMFAVPTGLTVVDVYNDTTKKRVIITVE